MSDGLYFVYFLTPSNVTKTIIIWILAIILFIFSYFNLRINEFIFRPFVAVFFGTHQKNGMFQKKRDENNKCYCITCLFAWNAISNARKKATGPDILRGKNMWEIKILPSSQIHAMRFLFISHAVWCRFSFFSRLLISTNQTNERRRKRNETN